MSRMFGLSRMGLAGVVLAIAYVTLLLATAVSASAAPMISMFPTRSTSPNEIFPSVGITAGPDGKLWYTDHSDNKIGRMTTDGVEDGQFTMRTTGKNWPAAPMGIAVGPNGNLGSGGNLWFVDQGGSEAFTHGGIQQITPTMGEAGVVPLSEEFNGSYAIATGPDHNIWFTAPSDIGRLKPTTGEFTAYLTPEGAPDAITPGPNHEGALWVSYFHGVTLGATTRNILQITTEGVPKWYSLPDVNIAVTDITNGPGNEQALWFTEAQNDKIGRITTAGEITEFPTGQTNGYPAGITAGSDGNLWFTEQSGNRIGRVEPGAVVAGKSDGITEFPIPTTDPHYYPTAITAGSDGNVWFIEGGTIPYLIGRANFTPGGSAPTVTHVFPNKGPASGGSSTEITGTGFTGVGSVTFGGNLSASFKVNSPTSITAVVPEGIVGTVHVTVKTPNGTSPATGKAAKHAKFTYKRVKVKK